MDEQVNPEASVKTLWDGIRLANESFGLLLNKLLSWPIWVPVLLFGSFFGLVIRQEDLVMLLLTIQTSVDAAATKTLQSHIRQKDESRDALIAGTVASIATLVDEVRAQNNSILDLMRATEKRDLAAAKRDKLMLNSLDSMHEVIDFVTREGVKKNDSRRSTRVRRASSGKRPAHKRRAKASS